MDGAVESPMQHLYRAIEGMVQRREIPNALHPLLSVSASLIDLTLPMDAARLASVRENMAGVELYLIAASRSNAEQNDLEVACRTILVLAGNPGSLSIDLVMDDLYAELAWLVEAIKDLPRFWQPYISDLERFKTPPVRTRYGIVVNYEFKYENVRSFYRFFYALHLMSMEEMRPSLADSTRVIFARIYERAYGAQDGWTDWLTMSRHLPFLGEGMAEWRLRAFADAVRSLSRRVDLTDYMQPVMTDKLATTVTTEIMYIVERTQEYSLGKYRKEFDRLAY